MFESKESKEIHKIREKLYEETKHLTSEQWLKRCQKEADLVIKKYGLKLKKFERAA